uniref:Venom protein n=1 Tax=Hadrurus spadix TaxID=141984 RepID=A0A1W7R985_9SCOR
MKFLSLKMNQTSTYCFALLIFFSSLYLCHAERNIPLFRCDSPGEIFQNCGTACPLTCDNYQNPPKYCTRNCVFGCFCKKGLVRNKSGICVSTSEC